MSFQLNYQLFFLLTEQISFKINRKRGLLLKTLPTQENGDQSDF